MIGGKKPTDGVHKKLFGQIAELRRLGIDVELVLIHIKNAHYPSYSFLTTYAIEATSMSNIIRRLKRAYKISKVFGEIIGSLNPGDVLYYRYSDPFPLYYPINYFKMFRACRMVTEHQTKELIEFKMNKNDISYWAEFFFGKLLKRQSDAVIGVTDEIARYEVACSGDPKMPSFVMGNGFSAQSAPLRQVPRCNDDELQLLCVANVSHWHGFDRLLQGLATYSKTPGVVLHIAGDGDELPILQKLADDLGISDQVVFHGFTTGKALDALFDQCHIAVGSLGIHRKGLTQTSELKGREYCSRGIPYIIACNDLDFPIDFPYILYLPADESPIDVERVLAFAKRVCADPDHPQEMHRYAEEHLDWSVKMKSLKEFLETLVKEGEGGIVKV